MNNIKTLLFKLGFKKTEVATYLHLLEKGSASISMISKDLRIHRPLIYEAIESLMNKDLCSVEIKQGRKVYLASNPEAVKKLVSDINIDLEEAMPSILDLYKRQKTGPIISVLKGPAGITQTFADSIRSSDKGSTFYRYTSEKDLDKVNEYLPRNYRKIRDEKKLERLVISNSVSGSRKKPRLERFIKFVPKEFEQFEQNIIQLIYADKVALIDLNTETSLIIENKPLADFQKTIFKMLYRKL